MLKKAMHQLLGSRFLFNFLLKEQEYAASHIYFVCVDPKRISHISLIPEDSCWLTGPEAAYGAFAGYFDLIKRPFERHFLYHTVGQLLQGEARESTPYFKRLVINDGKNKAITRLEKLERFIKSLSNDGYLSQYVLGNMNITQRIREWDVPLNETIVGMDRGGVLFRINGGRHRLAIAQHIGITEMPAILTLYHQDALDMLPPKRRQITGDPRDFRPF